VQLQNQRGRHERIASRYDDFTADVHCNQVPKATGELLLASPLLGEEARARLRRVMAAFATVSKTALTPESFTAAEKTLPHEEYASLLTLCRFIANGLIGGQAGGSALCPSFLLDMELVFERYVSLGIAKALGADERLEVAVQPVYAAERLAREGPEIHLRPDLVVSRGEMTLCVVDAKWKRLRPSAVITDDVYQLLAYCTALGARRGMLIYPGRRDRVWTYTVGRGAIRWSVRTLGVSGSPEQCRRSMRRLMRFICGTMAV
jgi:5-methylcytosine-specific restriction enzyme subunit McrC